MNPDVDPDNLAKALRYDEEVTNAIVAYLPKRKQAMFTAIDKPISKGYQGCKSSISSLARTLVDDGQFSMDDIFGQEELE